MFTKRFLDSLKLIIPLTSLLLMLLSHFTAFGQYLKVEDSIIFMICGLTLVTGIETLKEKPGVGFFLISSSFVIIAMRLILLLV